MRKPDRTSTYRVVGDVAGGAVIRDGRADPLWRAADKSDAMEYGRRVAVNNQSARLLVYRDEGAVESECMFRL